MLKVFNKTIKRIDRWQEDCSQLIFALETMLGENTSIADIAVNKTPEVKKKKLKEATTVSRGTNVKKVDSAGNVNDVSRDEVRSVERLKRQGYKVNEEDGEEEAEEPKEEPKENEGEPGVPTKDEREHPGQLRGKILKTEKELETNDSLRQWVFDYFAARRQGNFAEADVVKNKINSTIDEKRLDRETVFFGSDDAERAKEEAESDEKETEKETETEE